MIRLDETSAPVPWTSLAVESLDDELAVYDETTGRVHSLNAAAAVVWSMLDGRTSLADIAIAIASVADATLETVWADVITLACDLDAAGLLARDVDQAAIEPPGP